ncbi:MAG: 50S ribosomal protein L4 [Armatimonadetes bacterium]|nr:50S ribosomal protein L4 [Armatimonadota bacterium]
MKVKLYTQTGKAKGTVDLPDEIFDVPMNADLLHQAVRVATSRRRRTLAHAKDRSEVRGGGRKPWRQKGTGRARHGSIRSPLWRGGGVTFGPRNDQHFARSLPQAMRRKALAIALSAKAREGEIAVLEKIELAEAKTKYMAEVVKSISTGVFGVDTAKRKPTILVATARRDEKLTRASRNLPGLRERPAKDLNVIDVLSSRYLVFSKDAIPFFEDRMRVRREKPEKTRTSVVKRTRRVATKARQVEKSKAKSSPSPGRKGGQVKAR